ncbi:hypothetical protein C8R47DRAFT_377601 [Mycena vitilis]|nr:hypothetical protein C8R47DRAFT_377601 [Mycena vitilis]
MRFALILEALNYPRATTANLDCVSRQTESNRRSFEVYRVFRFLSGSGRTQNLGEHECVYVAQRVVDGASHPGNGDTGARVSTTEGAVRRDLLVALTVRCAGNPHLNNDLLWACATIVASNIIGQVNTPTS